MDALGHIEYLNCFLVTHDVRDAFLYQTVDYNEYDIDMPITKNKLALMKEYFPSLLHTVFRQGVLLSKKTYPVEQLDRDDAFLGKLLGFPCDSLEFIMAAGDVQKYDVHINVSMQNNAHHLSLISFVCLDPEAISVKIAELITKIESAFKTDEQLNTLITLISPEIETEYTEDALIKKLIDNETLNTKETDALHNVFYNMSFSLTFQFFMDTHLQYTNPVHRGIVIGLLTASKYSVLQPFCPLQCNGLDKMALVEAQTLKWEQYIMQVLTNTKN